MSITTISSRNFNLEQNTTPDVVGPGSYDPHIKDLRKRSQLSMEIPFGSTTRRELFNLPDNEDIGPGKYDPQLIVKGASPKYDFTFSSKRNYFVDYEKTPSPAEYSNISNWIVTKSKEPSQWQHPTSHNTLASLREKGPTGLGNADINQDNTPDLSNFGRAIEDLDVFKIKSRHQRVVESSKLKVRPGTRAADFGRSKSPQRELVQYNGIPGPSDYIIKEEASTKTTKSPMFYPSQREAVFTAQKNTNETMIAHHAWCDVGQCKKAFGSGAKREIEFFIPETPGVGKYEVDRKKKIKKSLKGFGGSRLEVKNQTPGPGYYNLSTENKKFIGNGKRSKRGELWEIIETPAPNKYFIENKDIIERKGLLKSANPAFKDKSKRCNLENTETNPGPIYNTRPKTEIRGTFPKAARFTDSTFIGEKLSDYPSPAEYSIQKTEKISGGVFNKNAHKESNDTISPGPGRYKNIRSELSKPSYNVMFNPNLQKTIPYK